MTASRWLVWCVLVFACARAGPAPWEGPTLSQPRTELTVEQLQGDAVPDLLDMSFLAAPDWALGEPEPFVGGLSLTGTAMTMDFPTTRARYDGENLFPTVTLNLVSHDGRLIPEARGVVLRDDEDSLWDVVPGVGAVWREPEDGDWSRASIPLAMVERFFNQVRNCLLTFAYQKGQVTPAYLQCSQETADALDEQLGDLRALVPTTLAPLTGADTAAWIEAAAQAAAARIPTRPLSEWDDDGALTKHFEASLQTRASTSVGAVYADGTLFVHPPNTRHGAHPYPMEMRHGVYSVTKSLVGAVSLFYLAERYGEAIFDAPITDHVPALADRPEWEGVTFSHALNMATGTRGGESVDLLYERIVAPDSAEVAIANVADLGDAPAAPGEVFQYATTHTFVLSYAMQNYVEAREGKGTHYLDLVRDDVLVPIGAGALPVLHTRDAAPEDRIPTLGYGARPTLDEAARIARLIADEGMHEGQALLHRGKIREALGRTEWAGYRINNQLHYRHAFWSRSLRTGGCRTDVAYMQGYGGNHVVFLESGAIVFRFTDEFPEDVTSIVQGAEKVRSSCAR